jgi:hypothetical protein
MKILKRILKKQGVRKKNAFIQFRIETSGPGGGGGGCSKKWLCKSGFQKNG